MPPVNFSGIFFCPAINRLFVTEAATGGKKHPDNMGFHNQTVLNGIVKWAHPFLLLPT